MSVPVNKRTQSKMEFMDQYYKIYDTLMYFLLKDFGIKQVVRNETAYIGRNGITMSDEDKRSFIDTCEKYGITYESEYPIWILNKYRDEIYDSLHRLLLEITSANSIYPSTEYEFNIRRLHATNAITECEYLLQCLQRVIHILPVNPEKYKAVVEAIQKEIMLLRGWKKASNKMRKNVLLNDAKAREKTIAEINRINSELKAKPNTADNSSTSDKDNTSSKTVLIKGKPVKNTNNRTFISVSNQPMEDDNIDLLNYNEYDNAPKAVTDNKPQETIQEVVSVDQTKKEEIIIKQPEQDNAPFTNSQFESKVRRVAPEGVEIVCPIFKSEGPIKPFTFINDGNATGSTNSDNLK